MNKDNTNEDNNDEKKMLPISYTGMIMKPLDYEKHVNYMLKLLMRLPKQYIGLDTSRMTSLYFSIVGLDILGALDRVNDEMRQSIKEFILAMQLSSGDMDLYPGHCGFIGSPYLGHLKVTTSNSDSASNNIALPYIQGHLAMTYTSLAILKSLEIGYDNIDKNSIIKGLKFLQKENGVFSATFNGCECDMRFVYCACAISYLLDDWSGLDTDQVYEYIDNCITYEGGIALIPGAEAHGGSTYCGTASLALMDKLKDLNEEKRSSLIYWCHQRQIGGFQGRTNKDVDTCYSFWIGATLTLLESFDDTDVESALSFILNRCQFKTGGFTKFPDGAPDILHTFYSLCYLSLAKHDKRIKLLNPMLAITDAFW